MPGQTLDTRLDNGIAAALVVDRGRAQELLREVVDADPRNVEAWLWLAAVASTPAEAAPCLARVIEIAPDHPYARPALGRVLLNQALACAATDPAAARSLFAEAGPLLPEGDETKQAALNRLVARAVTLVRIGRRDEAREVFEDARRLSPDDARVWYALSQLAATRASSLEPLRRAVQLDPNHTRARRALAELLAELAAEANAAGDRSGARSLLSEASALDGSNVDIWIARGRAEESDEVMVCVERIRALSPEHPAVTDLGRLVRGRFD